MVKVRREAKPDALSGRLENIVTGQQREFANAAELLDSLSSDIEAASLERPAIDRRRETIANGN